MVNAKVFRLLEAGGAGAARQPYPKSAGKMRVIAYSPGRFPKG